MILTITKKIVKYLDSLLDAGTMIICLTFFLIGLYALYDSYLVYMDANDTSLLKFKPGYGSEEVVDKDIIEEDMVAWLTIDDTSIDYPVMQGEDNNEYLNKDPYGDYSLSGSIFLDSRNTRDFSDDYSLVYGHHMDRGMMFGALDKFLDEDYFNSHRSGALVVDGIEYSIDIFAVLETEATNEKVFAPTEVEFSETLDCIENSALYYDEKVIFSKGSKLFGMSTCKFPDTVDRTLVFGYIKKTGRIVDMGTTESEIESGVSK